MTDDSALEERLRTHTGWHAVLEVGEAIPSLRVTNAAKARAAGLTSGAIADCLDLIFATAHVRLRARATEEWRVGRYSCTSEVSLGLELCPFGPAGITAACGYRNLHLPIIGRDGHRVLKLCGMTPHLIRAHDYLGSGLYCTASAVMQERVSVPRDEIVRSRLL